MYSESSTSNLGVVTDYPSYSIDYRYFYSIIYGYYYYYEI